MYFGTSAAAVLSGNGAACAENHSQLQFGMCLVALPAQRDHAVPRLILIG